MKAHVKDSARGQSDAAASFTFTTIDDLLRTINANRFRQRNACHGHSAGRLGNGEH
jgi:hypothetical protein